MPQAISLIESTPRIDGVLTDWKMPGGSGLDVLERFRAKFATAPAALVTSWMHQELFRRCFELSASYLPKEDPFELVATFAGRVQAHVRSGQDIELRVMAFAHEHLLSRRETQILELRAGGATRKEMTRKLGVTVDTLKHQISSILDKCGMDHMSDVVASLGVIIQESNA